MRKPKASKTGSVVPQAPANVPTAVITVPAASATPAAVITTPAAKPAAQSAPTCECCSAPKA